MLAVAIVPAVSSASHAEKPIDQPPLVIEKDTQLDPAQTYGRIVIKASNITIDGKGANIVGAMNGDPKTFQGTGISAEGVSGVTLRNVIVKGWETGVAVKDAQSWTIEGCDFSGNFHDPKFGWGENGRRGGIVLTNVKKSKLLKNQAHDVWDACVLVDCDENTLARNDFSHTSDTCLKLWNSSGNIVQDNVLSHGIRKDPGEVHARDSTSVLMESGSNRNRFLRNDCTHGGDGIFIRVLNGWVSTDNYFEENDCSYANNNCVEAWSPRNTWVRNKANHGSYGFWLGASDQNVLIGNEASFNGLADGNHNSPHLPDNGHARHRVHVWTVQPHGATRQ
jgi:parallel beta-helix repeat protein